MSGWGSKPADGISGGSSGSVAGTPFTYSVTAMAANTEYSQVLPPNTKIIYLASRDAATKLRVAYAPSAASYVTIHFGNHYYLTGLDLTGKTIYFQSSKAGVIIEIEAWV